jgi:hypothetical protein
MLMTSMMAHMQLIKLVQMFSALQVSKTLAGIL